MSGLAFSVVIPSFQSAGTLNACLEALHAQPGAPCHEIIVVDSSPDEAAAARARACFPGIHLVRLPRPTEPGQARNAGARLAQGQRLAFIDADCLAPPNWLARLAGWLDQGYAGVGGAIANGNPPDNLAAWAGYLSEFREFLPLGPAREVGNLTLGNAAYTREAFWAAGGFPANCFPQEDQVFHQAMRACGYRLWYDPTLAVRHFHRSRRADYLAHQHRIGQSNALVARRLGLPGAGLAQRRWLARLALPALALYRWARTLAAGRPLLANGAAGRAPLAWRAGLAWLCLQGMWWWGRGFVAGALPRPAQAAARGRTEQRA